MNQITEKNITKVWKNIKIFLNSGNKGNSWILDTEGHSNVGIKDFICNQCGKRFFTRKSLKNHLTSVHGSEKAFKCNHCDMAFALKGPLKRHIKNVHEGIKKFRCSHCDRPFSEKGNLNQHIRTVHKIPCGKKKLEEYTRPAIAKCRN